VSDYLEFRGKCKEMSEAACKADPSLTLVRGHYYCPMWNTTEAHWWCVKPDGAIFDPTANQFPSKGLGIYMPLPSHVPCEECGKDIPVDDVIGAGSYAVCSGKCYGRLVGVPCE